MSIVNCGSAVVAATIVHIRVAYAKDAEDPDGF